MPVIGCWNPASAVDGRGCHRRSRDRKDGHGRRPGGRRGLLLAEGVLVEHRQPLGDDRVRVLLAQGHEHAAQSILVRRRSRIAQEQVLGDDPRLLRLARFQVGLGELLLRGGERRFEIAVDAHLDEPQQRGQVARRLLEEALQPAGGLAEVARGGGMIDQQVDDRVARAGRRQVLAERGDFVDRLGRHGEEPHQVVAGGLQVVQLQQDLAAGEQQLRLLAAAGVGQEALGAGHLVAGERRLGQAQRDLGGGRIRLDDFLEQFLRLARPLAGVELLRQRHQVRDDGLAGADTNLGRLEARLEVGRIELGEADGEGVGAVLIAARLALVDRRLEMGLGVAQLALLRRRLDQLQQRALVVGIELDDLAVAGRRLGLDAFLEEVVAEAHELRDGLRPLAGAPGISQGRRGGDVVGIRVDDVFVFRDRAIEPPLSEQFLGFAQRVVSVDGHSSLSRRGSVAGHSMVSNSVGV